MVSVIIPTYNRAQYIERAITSVLNQTYKDFEIIVVDDNDPETEARKALEEKMMKYKNNSKIKYLQHPKNMNGAVARNTGIKEAKGEYITFLDDDDYFISNRLEKMVNSLEKRKDYSAAYSSTIVTNNKKIIGNSIAEKSGKMKNELLKGTFSFGTGSNMFFRAETIKNINGFDESFKRHQDIETMIRFFDIGKLLAVKEYLVVKTQDDRSNEPNMKKYIEIKKNYFKAFDKDIANLNDDDKSQFYKRNFLELAEASIRSRDKENYKKFIGQAKKYNKITCKEKVRIILLKINNYIKIEKFKYFIKRVILNFRISKETMKEIVYYEDM